ncbi:MAG: hypothetical protein LZF84_08465 [Nitrosomonas sp.]|nr:hypothetical protein [Nitrosomonas sp.]UJP07079.1 MAG: hypothetical protein LZF84_08465 [Nitrosomonas sp.]
MSNRTSNDAPNESTQSHTGRKPDQIAYTVRETSDGKEYWNRIGAMWKHKDGRGSELVLDSIPMDGRITLREQRDQRMQDYQDERAKQQPVNNTRTRDYGRDR